VLRLRARRPGRERAAAQPEDAFSPIRHRPAFPEVGRRRWKGLAASGELKPVRPPRHTDGGRNFVIGV